MRPLQFVNSNFDAEFQFIIVEGVSSFVEGGNKPSCSTTGKGITRGQCVDLTAKLVFETIISRHPELAEKFSEYEMLKVANNIFQGMDCKDVGYRMLYPQIAERLLHYMSVRLMGVPTPYVDPNSRDDRDNYWPFGKEGGFCNPMKLKALNDE